MCGIAGVIRLGAAPPASAAPLDAMCRTLVHRGPDDLGLWSSEEAALGLRRLAVIDVQGGRQPYRNEDGTVHCVFNGEIYNYRELAAGLRARGHVLNSAADGEVLVHLWEEHGDAMLSRLNGMFALALFDQRTGRGLLARDRVGVKPLYFAVAGGWLVFGSEVKAILESGVVPRDLDSGALAEFLAWEYVPAPGTLFRHVRKLGPGELLRVGRDGGPPERETWWDLPAPATADPLTDREWADRVDEGIRSAVRRQLVSDVPLGAFLSGGVDSSLIAAAMGPEARTFSIGFSDPSYDESGWASRVARHLGVRHRIETLVPDAGDLFGRLMHHMDDPIADFSIFPTFLVSQVAREEVTVVLTGDGGDELFGGYETYLAQSSAEAWLRVPGPVLSGLDAAARRIRPRPAKKGLVNRGKRFLEGMTRPADLEHTRWRLFADARVLREILSPDVRDDSGSPDEHIRRLFSEAGDRSALDRRLYVDFKSYLAENCLAKVDRMSMACSLEARVPLLDPDVVELAFTLPPHLKLRNGTTKPLLKAVAARHVPAAAVHRPKEGFSIPMKHWLGSGLRPAMEDLLAEDRLRQDGLFHAPAVSRLKREHLSGTANHSHLLWALMVFQDWQRRWRP